MAFGATRLVHRMVTAIEDAGWEVRDLLVWAYGGRGMPKVGDLGKDIDEVLGAPPLQLDRRWMGASPQRGKRNAARRLVRVTAPSSAEGQRWHGWSTALAPAWEPIVLARKPFPGTLTANVLDHGVGALNIEASRIEGRWPANMLLTDPVLGSRSPLFMVPKASGARRAGAEWHDTVKPLDLMLQLVRLVTPPGGHVLDPFCGSGSTGVAAALLGMDATLIELTPEYAARAQARLDGVEPL